MWSMSMRKSASTIPIRSRPHRRDVLRWLIATLYIVAGLFHLAKPGPFVQITPDWVPWKEQVVFFTGIFELVAAGFLLKAGKPQRAMGAVALSLYALAVWPANYNHMLLDMARPAGGLGLGYHIPRLMAQPLLIWATLWSAWVIEWPFGRRSGKR